MAKKLGQVPWILFGLLFLTLSFYPCTVSGEIKPWVKLSEEEELNQIPFYEGNDCSELIHLCDRPGTQVPDFRWEGCIANNITLDLSHKDYANLTEQRRKQLEYTINKVKDFQRRVGHESWVELTIQTIVFILPLCVGIRLVSVRHFDFRTLYDPYFPDPTFGMPCWQYLRMKYAAIKIRDDQENAAGAAAAQHADTFTIAPSYIEETFQIEIENPPDAPTTPVAEIAEVETTVPIRLETLTPIDTPQTEDEAHGVEIDFPTVEVNDAAAKPHEDAE